MTPHETSNPICIWLKNKVTSYQHGYQYDSTIIQFSSTAYIEHESLAPKYHQLNIHFVTSRQDWLSIAKPKITLDQPQTLPQS